MTDKVEDPSAPKTIRPDGPDLVGCLLCKMREGDRGAAALFVDRYGQRIRRRVQGRLRPYVRRLFDSQEIISTVARRLDLLVRAGKLQAATDGQLWSLVFTIAENAVIDKTRLFDRLLAIESSSAVGAHMTQCAPRTTSEHDRRQPEDIARAFSALQDGIDREILSLWLQDTPHLITARLVGLSPAAVRKRWEVIKRRLRPIFT